MKITYLGREVSGQYKRKSALAVAWQKFVLRLKQTIRIGGWITVAVWACVFSFRFGINYAHGTELSYIAPIALADTVKPEEIPILHKIALAESGDSQYCTKALVKRGMCPSNQVGAPLVHVNDGGASYDIGRYQINSTHLSEAEALGYDLYSERGNEAYARYLFLTKGSEPWYSSKGGWAK